MKEILDKTTRDIKLLDKKYSAICQDLSTRIDLLEAQLKLVEEERNITIKKYRDVLNSYKSE